MVGGGSSSASLLFTLPGLVASQRTRDDDDDDDDEGEDSLSADGLLMGSPPKSTKSAGAVSHAPAAFGVSIASAGLRPRVTSPAPHQPLPASSFRSNPNPAAPGSMKLTPPAPLQQVIFDDPNLESEDMLMASSRSLAAGASALNSTPTTARSASDNIDLLYGWCLATLALCYHCACSFHVTPDCFLITDPLLQCYYDPRTHKYYEIK
jgi:hypothetical protein